MSELTGMLVYTACSGACILIGGLAARIERIRPRWLETEFRHSVIAFGGGVLVAAVALVLVPEGSKNLPSAALATLSLLAGGVCFLLLERYLGLHKQEAPQFSAMLLDYLPESIALGGMFAGGVQSAPLLALLIGLQNLPEGFNAYRELGARGRLGSRRVLQLMALLIPLGPLFACLGWVYGARHPEFLGAVMLFSGGGILYLLFQDIAPQARLERHWAPSLGAVLGFGAGMLGQFLFGSAG
jgi:ZIP family zinc transporter